MRHLDRLLYLRGRVGKNVRVATGRRAMNVARVREQTGGAPQQFDAGALLFLLEHPDHRIQVFVGFAQISAFGCNVAVVKRVKRRAELFHEFKRHPGAFLRHLHRVRAVLPGPDGRAHSEHVGQLSAERMPIGDRKTEMILHRPAFDDFVGVIMFESERILRFRAFVSDSRCVRKRGFHNFYIQFGECGRLYRVAGALART